MDKALLDKIRKCLALGKSDNEHEAASALSKARALMEEHGITDAHLAFAEVEEATARANRTFRPPTWETVLNKTVCRALGVVSFLNGDGDRTFVGRGPTAEIASYAFAVLFRRLKSARRDYIKTHLKRCKPGRKRLRADVFCEAWALAVFWKIKKLMPEKKSDGMLENYLAERHPGLIAVSSRDAKRKGGGVDRDLLRGTHSGSQVDLNTGLSGGGKGPLALT